jgi:hypothetical protein
MAPLQVAANDSLESGNLFFGESQFTGNIFELTGIDPASLNDGVRVTSYQANMNALSALASSFAFKAEDVIGYVNVNGSEIVLLGGPGTPTELVVTNGQTIQFSLEPAILGSWSSPDGTTAISVGQLDFYAPYTSDFGTEFQPLILTYMYAEHRSPAGETPAAVAAVGGYLDTDTMQYTSAYDQCYEVGGSWTLKDWYSTASNYGTYIYAGCDGDWSFLFAHRSHGAWITIDNYGGVSSGGY